MDAILCAQEKAVIKWYSPITNRNITVDSKIKSRFTANGIMKDAGISYRF